jgi:hypothetical protein
VSWIRLEMVRYKVGTPTDLDTRCVIQGVALSGSDNVVLVITGPDDEWDGCPDVYHEVDGTATYMRAQEVGP